MIITAISRAESLKLFESIKSSMIGLDTSTIPVLLGGKSNEMQGRVRKVSTFSAMIGGSHEYAQKVTREAQKECESIFGENEVELLPFKAESLWKGMGEHIGGAVVRHKETDARYLVYYPGKGIPVVHYELDGKEIAKESIIGLNEKVREGKSVDVDGELMTLAIFPTTLKIESLKAFRINGEHYMIIENI